MLWSAAAKSAAMPPRASRTSSAIEPYTPAEASLWDATVETSRNGTFLLRRGYMDNLGAVDVGRQHQTTVGEPGMSHDFIGSAAGHALVGGGYPLCVLSQNPKAGKNPSYILYGMQVPVQSLPIFPAKIRKKTKESENTFAFHTPWGAMRLFPADKENQELYLISSIMEEAISSSQMEGAATIFRQRYERKRKKAKTLSLFTLYTSNS